MKQQAEIRAADLGGRVARLREQRGLSIGDLATIANLSVEDIERFERTGEGSVTLLLSLSGVLSSGDEMATMLTLPKFGSLDDVEAYERQRTGVR